MSIGTLLLTICDDAVKTAVSLSKGTPSIPIFFYLKYQALTPYHAGKLAVVDSKTTKEIFLGYSTR